VGKKNQWFGVRMIVEVKVPRETVNRRTYEDRIVVVRAASEPKAREKAEKLARAGDESYLNVDGETIRWRFKEILDSYEILDKELSDGAEVFSAFLNLRLLKILRDPRKGPWPAYQRAHPKADRDHVTVDELVDWWKRSGRGDLTRVLPVMAYGPWPAYQRAHPGANPERLKVYEVVEWYEKLMARDRIVRAKTKSGR
jgi:hypothetical protein